MKARALSAGGRPPYLTLLPPANQMAKDGEPCCITIEQGPRGEEVVLLTVPREPRLLRELWQRLGDRLHPYRVLPAALTFAVHNRAGDERIISLTERALARPNLRAQAAVRWPEPA
ncbi:MAG: hypothetical protein ACRDHX_06475 [Chloroflexota bacterium]